MLNIVKPTAPNKPLMAATVQVTPTRQNVISGHIFKDAGIRDIKDIALRRDVAEEISTLIKRKKLKAEDVINELEVHPNNAALLVKGEPGNYTLEQLLRLLTKLHQDVVITFMKAPVKRVARISVKRV